MVYEFKYSELASMEFILRFDTDVFDSSRYLQIFSKAEEKPRIVLVCFDDFNFSINTAIWASVNFDISNCVTFCIKDFNLLF
ncbi:hypothetical protein GCM10007028_35260 [Algibacter mikhailovii]|uniref:Uncharacterized protein n=1 Tax=Algibacter mikhailovii TaxID=425498 RepID=A0A918VFR7_9FLAO|nr:hypothetical protein GCM10007028_35260 [Algibacter mikhailovii]